MVIWREASWPREHTQSICGGVRCIPHMCTSRASFYQLYAEIALLQFHQSTTQLPKSRIHHAGDNLLKPVTDVIQTVLQNDRSQKCVVIDLLVASTTWLPLSLVFLTELSGYLYCWSLLPHHLITPFVDPRYLLSGCL